MNHPWLRAGLIGAGILVVLSLLGLIPLVGWIAPLLQLIAFAAAGVLAASFLIPRAGGGPSAGQGALAGLIVRARRRDRLRHPVRPRPGSAAGGAAAIIDQLPPELLQQLRQMGVDPALFITTGTVDRRRPRFAVCRPA